MIKSLIAAIQKQLADRRRYLSLVAEIDSLTPHDLADLRADPIEMRRAAFADVYGHSAA